MKRIRPCLWLIFGAAYIALWGVQPAYGQLTPAPGSAILVYAQTGQWSTELIASAQEASSFEYSNCVLGPLPRVVLPENGVARVKDFGRAQCGAAIGYVRAALPFGTTATSVFTFSDGKTFSHFAAPALTTSIAFGERRVIRRVINDGVQGTFLVFVNVGPGDTIATISTVAAGGSTTGTESVPLPVGVTAYTLLAPIDIGTLHIFNGALIGSPSIQPSTIYGFAAVGPQSGASQRVEVIE
jgi:hypothetical protein